MYAKIAFRNIRRQLSDYLIYFVTVTLTVSMMFALSNLIFSEQLLTYAKKIRDMQNALIAVAVSVSLVVSLVLGYASAFMLKLRKREFGTYLTLGMRRRSILLMSAVENLLIGLCALVCGILIGLSVFQGMIGLVARVLEINISFGRYSPQGLLLTVCLAVGVYLLSTASSALYLRRVSIYELLHAEKKVAKPVRHPFLFAVMTVLSFAAIVAGALGTYLAVRDMFMSQDSESRLVVRLFGWMAVFLLAVIFYHIGFCKSAMGFLLRRKSARGSGTDIFVLRQLSAQMNTNAVLCAIIAFLITSTVLCTNICLCQKVTEDSDIKMDFPFDISMDVTEIEEHAPYDVETALREIETFSHIRSSISYDLYTSGNGYLYSFTPFTGEGYEGLFDTFIRESDFNRLIAALGYPEVELGNSFMALSAATYLSRCDFSAAELKIGSTVYTLKEATGRYPSLWGGYCLFVVPDEAVLGMERERQKTVLNLEDNKFDVQKMYDTFAFGLEREGGYFVERCPVTSRAYYEQEQNSLTAILIVGELYMSIIFVFLATAILTVKLLTETDGDRSRYDLLYKLGADRRQREKTLFCQTFAMFALPSCLPILLSIPVACVCGRIAAFHGHPALIPEIYANAALTAAVLLAIQMIYFGATYLTKKRAVIIR